MNTNQLFLSTIDPEAHILASSHGVGIEIAETCTAWNIDMQFAETDRTIRQKVSEVKGRAVMHGPFNELFPCAIDPKARELTHDRYLQAMKLASGYGIGKLILHGGYNPLIYYHPWYVEQSILFWRELAREIPGGLTVCLENVLEEVPGLLFDIVSGVDHPQLKLCLDLGHVHAYSKIPAEQWITVWQPCLSHFHIHQNDRTVDAHWGLDQGTLPMKELLLMAEQHCPKATFTVEVPDCKSSIVWLYAEGILKWEEKI